ncbi:MAG: PIN domain-containing protein [Candidatus Lokiarchaeia archaeon]
MKILIDTSYFLPLIKIGIENIPQTVLVNLLSKTSHEYFYSNLTLFELTAKGLKFSSQKNTITPQDIRIGIDAIRNDLRLTEKSFIDNPLIIELASQLKAIHNNTIDCLIFATAICVCDCIITMDGSLFDQINKTPSLINKIREINENFRFWFNDLSEDLKGLKSIDS